MNQKQNMSNTKEQKNTFRRAFRAGMLNFKRHRLVSIASILVMTVTLFVIASLIFTQAILQSTITNLEKRVDVKVYFVTGAAEEKILALQKTIEDLPEVASVKYVSENQALSDFRERHKDDALTMQALDEIGKNPLGASFDIKAKSTAQYESIVRIFGEDTVLTKENRALIDKVNYDQNKEVIERLSRIISGSRALGFGVTLIACIIAIIITFNTIRLTMHFTKEEIKVMRLVGASSTYVRGPFVVEGVLYGLLATLVTLLLLIPATLWAGQHLTGFLGINLFTYFWQNSIQIILILLSVGTIIGAVSSVIAVRSYLKV
jgi:cell division transport system permease protein